MTTLTAADGKQTIKVVCNVHKNCMVFRSARVLPSNANTRFADWLLSGYLDGGDAGSAAAHKARLDVLCHAVTVKVGVGVLKTCHGPVAALLR